MSVMFAAVHGIPMSVVLVPDVPGLRATGSSAIRRMRLPTESIGTFALTLTNLVIGSAVLIETQAGTAIENRTADATSEAFAVPAFAAGNASNDLRIKVRKGSAAPFYQPYETQATAFVGAQSIFVSQIPD